MTVSVIVPVYNVAPFFDECMESICAQTYKELEIILIDDGSTDDSGEKCDQWCDKDSRVRVIHQKNSGVSSARNTGLYNCTGDLICFVDADDRLETEMIEKLVECLKKNGADAAMCGYVDYPYGLESPVKKGIAPVETCGFEAAIIPILSRNGYFTSVWGKLFRRNAVYIDDNCILMDSDLAFGEDELWLFKTLKQCQKISFVSEALYHWRPREGSITRCNGVTEKQMTILAAKRRTMELLPSNNRKIQKLAKSCVFNNCYKLKVQAYCSGDETNYRILSNELRFYRNAWLFSLDPPLLRKIKVILMALAMGFHAPPNLLYFLSSLQKK